MNGKTAEEYTVYDKYLDRSDSTISIAGKGESISDEDKSKRLTRDITSKQIELLKTFPNLSLISSTIEDTIIVVDDDGMETAESIQRREAVLNKLNEALKKDTALLNTVREIFPSFCRNMENVLGDKYYLIYSRAESKLRKLCGFIASTPTYEYDDEDEYFEDYKEGDFEDYEEVDETSLEDDEDALPYYSPNDLYQIISEELDTDDFQRACILAKTYLKNQIEFYKSKINPSMSISQDVETFCKENNDSLDTISKYTAYLNMPKNLNSTKEDREK